MPRRSIPLVTPQHPQLARGRWTRLALAGAAGAAIIVALVAVLAGDFSYAALGTSDPGALARIVAPLLRLVVDVLETVCVGALAFAAFFTRPRENGLVSPPAFAALQTAGRAAAGWAVAVLVLWPFDTATQVGLPMRQVLTVH